VELLQQIIIWALPVIAAIVLHEVAHGFVADRLGDPTAKERGRLTLNPISHVDPFGTVALPAFLIFAGSPFVFGYAKPVPVDFRRLRNPKRDMVWVAAAGPATNVVLAVASAVAFHLLMGLYSPGASPLALEGALRMLQASVIVNIVLAVFNLLPILPLDGGRVLTGLLPLSLAIPYSRLEPFGLFIVIGLLAFNVLTPVLGPVVSALSHVLLSQWA
jgi:Zn-dependent protease